jgi:hypothetical protein
LSIADTILGWYRELVTRKFDALRSFDQAPRNLTPAVALVEQSKIYPLNGKAAAKPMQFPDASGVPANRLPVIDEEWLELIVR